MKLNPFKSHYFRKSAQFTLETMEDTEALATAFLDVFSKSSGLKRIGLMGVPKSGKSTFANAFVQALQPLEITSERIVLEKPFRIYKKPDEDFYLRHYDAAMLRCAPEDDKAALGSFNAYFRDVNPSGIDIVEHPEQEKPDILNGQNADFNYVLRFQRASYDTELRTVTVYPAATEVRTDAFKDLIAGSDDGYRCFKKVMGIPLLP